jgi:hypothetical protein
MLYRTSVFPVFVAILYVYALDVSLKFMGTFQRTHVNLPVLLRIALGFHLVSTASLIAASTSVVVTHFFIQANDTSGGLWDAVITKTSSH